MTALPFAEVTEEDGVLRAPRFGDVYYSADDGLAESRHVFIAGNDLPTRFAALGEGEVFTVVELGFGTGLNIAAAMAAFAARGHERGHLHILSVEGFPLARPRFAAIAEAAAARWPEAAFSLAALAAVYPDPVPGRATVLPAKDVTLTLLFGEAAPMLATVEARADAFMLDGFSPAKNPQMWTGEIFSCLATLAATGASLATFTVAGFVRRGLAAAGFAPEKAPGFGRKREMLKASLAERPAPSPRRGAQALPFTPLLDAPPLRSGPGPVAVLGAGIAGAWLVHALKRRGVAAVLFDPDGLAAGASGNPLGLVTPRLDASGGPLAHLYRDAYLFALRAYERAAPAAILSKGAQIAFARERLDKALAAGLWPEGVILKEGAGRAGVPGALAIDPRAAIEALASGVPLIRSAPEIKTTQNGFILMAEGRSRPFAALVHANALRAMDSPVGPSVLKASRGQIDVFAGPAPGGILSGDGYAAPIGDSVVAGATYDDVEPDHIPRPDEASSRRNADTAARLLGAPPGPLRASRAALRAATPDRHPMAGPVTALESLAKTHADFAKGGPPGLPVYEPGRFVFSGLGSRGLATAPLLGEHIASLIAGGPSILGAAEAAALHPMRFALRALKRQGPQSSRRVSP